MRGFRVAALPVMVGNSQNQYLISDSHYDATHQDKVGIVSHQRNGPLEPLRQGSDARSTLGASGLVINVDIWTVNSGRARSLN